MTLPCHPAVRVPATTANLGPGFDAFGLALDRHLCARVRPAEPGGPRVEVHGEGADELPDGDDNLLWRSLVAFCERHDAAVPDAAVVAHSEVPLERGMGSSSAAIVAGLALARALTGVVVGDRDLVALADEIEGHPDNVAPALLGGLVACARDLEGGLIVRRINPTPTLRPVVLVPDVRQLTLDARASLPTSLTRSAAATQAGRAGHVLAGLAGDWPVAAEAAVDLLHEPARFEAMPATGRVVRALREAGVHAWLSGAGPSVAAVVPRREAGVHDLVAGIGGDEGFALRETDVELAGAVVCSERGCGIAGGGDCVQCPQRRV